MAKEILKIKERYTVQFLQAYLLVDPVVVLRMVICRA